MIFKSIITAAIALLISTACSGGAKDSWFQHLTYHKDVKEDASNEWLEPVTDEIYDKLQ
jgi:hypothetical protein